jgi:hypothetical protein
MTVLKLKGSSADPPALARSRLPHFANAAASSAGGLLANGNQSGFSPHLDAVVRLFTLTKGTRI